MPKIKSKKSATKRFKITATGKFRYPHAYKQKKLTKKSPKRKMRLRKSGVVDKTNELAVRRMMPYAK